MNQKSKPMEYYRLVRTDRNLFTVETITVENNKIVKTDNTEATFLPISFDRLRRRCAEAFFDAVREENGA